MSKTTYIAPVETFTGKLSSHSVDGRIIVSRRKCYGKDAKGVPIYGPAETYIYHRHEGKWSEGATNNRTRFREVQLLAKQELSDPERIAYWQPLFKSREPRVSCLNPGKPSRDLLQHVSRPDSPTMAREQ